MRGPLVSWHRGGRELAESASAEAFRLAARSGAELVEVDVRRSADGELVCVHDPEVPGLGAVTSLVLGDLDDLSRERILTLGAFLDVLDVEDPTRSVTGVHLDLKDAGYEVDAADAVLARGRRVFVTTSIEGSVALLRRERPGLDSYLTIGTSRAGLSRLAAARLRTHETFPMGSIRRTGATGVAVHHRLATPLLRAWCRHRGLAIVVWTVDRPERLERWLASDVDVVTTNVPLEALRIRQRQGAP